MTLLVRRLAYVKYVVPFICIFGNPIPVNAQATPAADPAGAFTYSRPVPTQSAQISGEPAAPSQVVLGGPGSAWAGAIERLTVVDDVEAAAIGAPTAFTPAEAITKHTDFGPAGTIVAPLGGGHTIGGQSGQQIASTLGSMHAALGSVGATIGAATTSAAQTGSN